MRRRLYLGGLLLCVAVVVGTLGALEADEGSLAVGAPGGGRAAQLERELGPGVDVALHRATGRVRFIGTAPGRPISRPSGLDAGAPPATVARFFVESHRRDFGLTGGPRSLRVTGSVDSPAGHTAVRLQQTIDGVPVLAGELVVGIDRAGNVLSALGEVEPDPVDTSPTVVPGEAGRIARTSIARGVPQGAGALRASEPRLAIYDSRLLGGPGPGAPRLVWRSEVTSPVDPTLRRLALVDANRGVLVRSIDLIAEAKERRVCDAANTSSDYPCVSYDREEGDGPSGSADIDDAFDFAGDTYDFFFNRFGRDSLDDAGLPLVSTVRYCPPDEACPYENAFWDGAQMAYGEGFAAADDVVGHELSHGVTDFSSKLFYWYQSGAINESLSDVFGEYMDLNNGAGDDSADVRWQVGEDVPGFGALRDMEDPGAFGDPDRMTSPQYVEDPNQFDNGGVHTNSGVNNKAAYLIADGDNFNGATVNGIGITKAARVYYEAETTQLTSGSDYADLYFALQQACSNAIGTDGISAADCLEVAAAVDATEMDQQPVNGPAPEAPVCGGSEDPVDIFFDDLEDPASGNWTHSALSGTDAWYYPQNPNPYAFDATYATSGSTNFWGDNPDSASDHVIEGTSDLAILAGTTYLRFDHSYGFEDVIGGGGKITRYDGGRLEYSVDGGSSWLDAGPLFTHNGYNGTIEDGTPGNPSSNPLAGESAFTADSNGYISSRVDLSSLAGEAVRFRFRIGTDQFVGDLGWFVDDIHVYRCVSDDTTPPDAPTITSTNPASPSNDNTPMVIGDAEAGSTVRIYAGADCSGTELDSGSASDFATPGIEVTVPADQETDLRATATDAAANTSDCSDPFTYTEDSTPPTNPTLASPSHTTSVPSNDPTVEITFTGAADSLSGLDGFSYAWDTSPTSDPGTDKDAEESAGGTTSPALADGSSHYFHLRTRDNAGNWTAPVHIGPFVIDTTAPAEPTLDSTDPTSPANDNSPLLTGTATGTVRIYDDADCTDPQLAGGTGAEFAAGIEVTVDDDSTTTFHATATDPAGNASDCSADSITYVEDSTAPTAQIDTAPPDRDNDPTPEFAFSADEDASFECQIDSGGFDPCTSPHTINPALSDGPHTFEVQATDQAGNTGSAASHSWQLDTDPPQTTIDSGPTEGQTITDPTPTFAFSADEDASFECQIDSGGFDPCTSPHTTSALADGARTFQVRGIDLAGNTGSTATRNFTVDTTPPPEPTFDSTDPASPANDNTPTVIGDAEAGSTVRIYSTSDCSDDEPLATGTATAFASGIEVTVDDDSTRTFHATATDPAGNASDCSADSITYVEDSTAPTAQIDSGPSEGGTIADDTPTFTFSVTPPEAVSFQCRVDADPFGPCTSASSHTTDPLTDDPHTFEVRATDAVGNTGAPATRNFTLDTSVPPDTTPPDAPTITSTNPASPSNDDTPMVIGDAEAGSTVRIYTEADCNGSILETGSASDFASPGIEVTVDDDSTTTFHATAEDALGNVSDCSTDSITYVEDSMAPTAQIDTAPPDPDNDHTPTFEFSSSDVGVTFECRIDTNPFTSCTSPHTTAEVADGSRTFEVRATDTAGNTGVAAVYNWEIDTTPPAEPEPDESQPTSPSPDPSPQLLPDLGGLPADLTPPNGVLFGPRRQIAGRVITARMRCSEVCVLIARARAVFRLRTRSAPASRRRVTIGLRPIARRLGPGQTSTLRLKPRTRRARRALRRLARRSRRARAVVVVRYADLAGNLAVRRMAIGLLAPRRR